MSAVIFLSHAVADRDIAAEFTRLLGTGLEVTGREVFCSSLPGRTIPGGFNFIEHIKANLESSKVVILLLTENYLASQFCLAEAGAAWISKGIVIPVVIPPFTRARLSATLSVKQAWKINDDDDLNSVADDIRGALEIATHHGQWGAEKKAFLKKIEDVIKAQIPPKSVDPAEYEKLKEELAYSETSIQDLRAQLEAKSALLDKIKLAKDVEEVNAIELDSLEEIEAFDKLAKELSKAIRGLPSAAAKAMYYYARGESLPIPEFGYTDTEDKWRDIRQAQNKNMLSDEAPFDLNDSHPKVSVAIAALKRLEHYMEANDEVLRPLIESHHKVTYELSDEDFWAELLKLRLGS